METKNVLSTLITAMTFCRHFVSMNCLLTKWKTIRNLQASGNALSPVCGVRGDSVLKKAERKEDDETGIHVDF